MRTATAAARISADEFFDWCSLPENANRKFELVRGRVVELPLPTRIHGVVSASVAYALGTYVRQRRRGYIATNDSGTGLERNPDTVRGPDVALYEDASAFNDLHPKYGETPPILAVEVLSPDDRVSRVLRKIDDYLHNGVRIVWLVGFEERTVRIFKPQLAPMTRTAAELLEGDEVLPNFRCPVREFFVLPEDSPADGAG